MDYFGFQPSMYQLKFKSKGDSKLSQRIVQLYQEVRGVFISYHKHRPKFYPSARLITPQEQPLKSRRGATMDADSKAQAWTMAYLFHSV